MKVSYQNQHSCKTLSKRPKSGDKENYQTIIGSKIRTKHKYESYFQSPNKGEDLLFIKKKFQKIKKNSKEKLKNKTGNNTKIINNNSKNNKSSSYISFLSPKNKNHYNKNQNNALTKFLKSHLILNSIDDGSSFVTSKEKVMHSYYSNINNNNLSNILKGNLAKNNEILNINENNNINSKVNTNINSLNDLKMNSSEYNNIISCKNSNRIISKMISPTYNSNKRCTPESSRINHNRFESNPNLNYNLNENSIKDIYKNKKNKSNKNNYSKNKENSKKEKIKEKLFSKDKDSNYKINRKSYKFNFLNNNSNNNNFNSNKLYSYKGMNNTKKHNKNNFKSSNQNILSNTVFEYKKSHYSNNNINFFENYVKAVAKNKNNKYSNNKSVSIYKSNNFNSISKKKNNNINFNSNNVSITNTNRETNPNSLYETKNIFPNNMIQSPKNKNISKTTKNSPKSSLNNLNGILNKVSKKVKGHIKNKSISIITKSEASILLNSNNNNSNINGSITNQNKKKINYNNMNYSKTHINISNGNNLYSSKGYHQYKYSLNLNKKLNLLDIGNNISKKASSSPYNIYFKKKTIPSSKENISNNHNNQNNKKDINIVKNYNNLNTTGNNFQNKNVYVNKNYLLKHKNLSSLNNSSQLYYNNITGLGTNSENEISSPTYNKYQKFQKTEDININNYNININTQIHNSHTFFSDNIINLNNKKMNKNNNYSSNHENNNIPYKQNLKKKKIFSQSLKDILISNNKKPKNFTTNNSPINKLGILLNGNNNIKNNENDNSENKADNNKYSYKKWSSNREKPKKEIKKKRVFESTLSRKEAENQNIKFKLDNNNNINKNNDKNNIENNIENNKNNNIVNLLDSSQRKYIDLKKIIDEEIENNSKKNKNSIKDINIQELKKKKNNNKKIKINKINDENNIENISNNRNKNLSLSQNEPTLSSNSSISYDANYYMKESLKLSCYISKFYNKYKEYPNTTLQFYKYGRLIGQGAFGKVNLGLNILTGRIVAIKSFNKNNSELTGDNMKKIKYETDLMKKLNHPNITKILEMFEDEKFFLIIMEYINGGNLFSFVKKRRKLSEKTAKFLFKQIILGIKYIHEQNIVHRDIKLENLLIDLNNNVKICDFGIGKKVTNKSQLLYDQCGTLMYMAPEILLSTKEKGYEGFPVDIWSSGISLYIMLSGTLPFNYKKKKNKSNENNDEEEEEDEESISSKSKSKKNDEDNFELQYNIVYKEPKHIDNISEEARDLLKGLLNKDPKKRLTCEQILNHPWLYNFKEKNNSSKKFHLFTKAEMIMLSKTFIDYRRANSDDLKENFTLSNLEIDNNKNKNNSNEKNITSKSSILGPYNSIISDYENDSSLHLSTIKDDDSFNDFNNSKIKLEKDRIIFSRKIKEFNRLYELNNNGEVDNGVLINSKTQSSINMTDRSNNSRISNKNNNKNDTDVLDLNLETSNGSYVIFNENEGIIEVKKNTKVKEKKNKIKENDKYFKNNVNREIEQRVKINNILNQISLMGYDKKYVLDCVKKNELCHASTVYYLMINYENI